MSPCRFPEESFFMQPCSHTVLAGSLLSRGIRKKTTTHHHNKTPSNGQSPPVRAFQSHQLSRYFQGDELGHKVLRRRSPRSTTTPTRTGLGGQRLPLHRWPSRRCCEMCQWPRPYSYSNPQSAPLTLPPASYRY